jgi:hypothetical protein
MLQIGGCLFFPSLCRGLAISILLVPVYFFVFFCTRRKRDFTLGSFLLTHVKAARRL